MKTSGDKIVEGLEHAGLETAFSEFYTSFILITQRPALIEQKSKPILFSFPASHSFAYYLFNKACLFSRFIAAA